MYLSDTMPTLLAKNTTRRYNALSIDDLGEVIAQRIIHSTYFDLAQHKYSHINISDSFAKCLNVLLKLPTACVHVRTHGKTVCLANLFVG